ncbi:hypothetical protein EJ02DRAFT_237991 [Clathrospora elynae]|uniref:Uncharacterized protein n=1 Tax=Clathrospora elynae TaxID=706981 RepID=A0A6A5SKI2_9PLEO|nr:hypothetical protein EJ02DRAFT_237991 [Clathrospora elynae]
MDAWIQGDDFLVYCYREANDGHHGRVYEPALRCRHGPLHLVVRVIAMRFKSRRPHTSAREWQLSKQREIALSKRSAEVTGHEVNPGKSASDFLIGYLRHTQFPRLM